jgi:hypothetical protein
LTRPEAASAVRLQPPRHVQTARASVYISLQPAQASCDGLLAKPLVPYNKV